MNLLKRVEGQGCCNKKLFGFLIGHKWLMNIKT